MAKLTILHGQPADPAAFEDYYANQHLPFAIEHMPNVRGAENTRVLGAPGGAQAPYYRTAQMSYDSVSELEAGIASEQGRAVLADLQNFATGGVTVPSVRRTSHHDYHPGPPSNSRPRQAPLGAILCVIPISE